MILEETSLGALFMNEIATNPRKQELLSRYYESLDYFEPLVSDY